jgi:hypothetical protein
VAILLPQTQPNFFAIIVVENGKTLNLLQDQQIVRQPDKTSRFSKQAKAREKII